MSHKQTARVALVPPVQKSVSFNQEALTQQLIRHEGLMCGLYLRRNSEVFIGVGRNLSRVGVSEEEAYYLISRDVKRLKPLLEQEENQFVQGVHQLENEAALSLPALLSDPHKVAYLFDNGITQQEAHYLLANDIKRIEVQLSQAWASFSTLPFHHQAVLINMAFDIGVSQVLRARDLLAALAEGAIQFAAIELEVSDWAKLEGKRVKELVAQLRLAY
ncbi:hypothetical protein [uncultured Shewanella sp.]|uniref:glycoside hydrolase family protein n=1 Tax=uncultured Shewanella sp. TaxID=173975 RepID=UPI002606E2B5|nr:hypothetical protein [uncultured Shewanella sp.]